MWEFEWVQNVGIKVRSSHKRCSIRKTIVKIFFQNSQENTCVGVSFMTKFKALELYQKETSSQVF